MDQSNRFNGPAFFHLIKDQVKLPLGHWLERFIVDRRNALAILRCAHHARKVHGRSHPVRHLPLRHELRFVERLGSDRQLALHREPSPRPSPFRKGRGREVGKGNVGDRGESLNRQRPFAGGKTLVEFGSSPSPLNGERAGVRGENVDGLTLTPLWPKTVPRHQEF